MVVNTLYELPRDNGTIFIVELPNIQNASTGTVCKIKTMKKHILIIEDDTFLGIFFAKINP